MSTLFNYVTICWDYNIKNFHIIRLSNMIEIFSQNSFTNCLSIKLLTLPRPIIVPPNNARLNLFNCPELVERNRCSKFSLSWMIQIEENNQQLYFSKHALYSTIVGIVEYGSKTFPSKATITFTFTQTFEIGDPSLSLQYATLLE